MPTAWEAHDGIIVVEVTEVKGGGMIEKIFLTLHDIFCSISLPSTVFQRQVIVETPDFVLH